MNPSTQPQRGVPHPRYHRLEQTWPHRGPNSFGYLPENANLTLKRARELVAKGRYYEGEGMRQRIVSNRTGKTVHYSRGKMLCARTIEGRRNMRGF